MKAPKIEVSNKTLSSLMVDFAQGEIRIPRFQREFVWERSRILKLLDSMLVEYPIGTIFLWSAPAEYNFLLRSLEELGQPNVQEDSGYRFILDGQQRLTSLFVAIQGASFDGEDYSKIVVDLEADTGLADPFKYRRPDNSRWVSLKDVLAYDIFAVYNNLPSDEHKKRFTEIRGALSAYPFSVVTVKDMEIDDAIEIFDRLNQQGRRLSRYDLICASVMTEAFDLRERSKADIIDNLKTGFGEIAETSIPQALALNSKGSTEHKSQLDLTTEEIEGVWDPTVEGFRTAADFVKENLGAARKDFLPYDAVLPVLAHYFFLSGSHSVVSDEHRKQLGFWFWRSAFAERYSGASQTRMNEDARWLKRLIDEGVPYPSLTITDEERLISTLMTWSTSAIRNGFLCLLNQAGPLEFKNRTSINLQTDHFSTFTSAEKHHIFPVSFLKQKSIDARRVHCLPNFCFIPADLNKWIADRAPSNYMKEILDGYESQNEFERVMSTHLIPVGADSGVWTDDYELFLQQRAQLLLDEIKRRCGIGSRIDSQKHDSVVDRLEFALRNRIHEVLQAQGAGYWKHRVPGEVRKRVEERIAKDNKNSPGSSGMRNYDVRAKLDFCDVSDYELIISRKDNWHHFASAFKNKDDCRRMLRDFSEFRAAVKHNRDISPILEHKAHAAILWLSDAIQLDLRDYGIRVVFTPE